MNKGYLNAENLKNGLCAGIPMPKIQVMSEIPTSFVSVIHMPSEHETSPHDLNLVNYSDPPYATPCGCTQKGMLRHLSGRAGELFFEAFDCSRLGVNDH